jgi:nitrite reductase (NADH) small subunit
MTDENKKSLRGREYLTAVRPEAMGHLLAFFKGAGAHLEPKTRFLISVLKQVVNFSPRGLKQYIRRAMTEGATRDEIIDTILLAYPLANLTRMADAVDVLLDMEAAAEPAKPAAPAGPTWQVLPGVAAPPEGTCSHATLGARSLLLARRNGTLHVLDDQCPHRGGPLHSGTLADGVVTCPLHGWSFKLEDGSSAGRGLGGATVIPVREANGRVEVLL